MKKSIAISVSRVRFPLSLFKGNLEETLAYLADLGYQGAELHVRDPDKIKVETVMRIAKRLNLEIPAVGTGQVYTQEGLSFSSPDPEIRKRAVERIKKHIKMASFFGAAVIIGSVRGGISQGLEAERALAWVLECMRECGKVAHDEGVSLALEPLNRYETNLINTVDQAFKFIEEVREEDIGLLVDTFHMNIEEISIYESIKKAKVRLIHVHVADSNREAPGRGHLDFSRIIETLRELGYEEYLSAEIMPLPTPHEAAILTLNELKRILD